MLVMVVVTVVVVKMVVKMVDQENEDHADPPHLQMSYTQCPAK